MARRSARRQRRLGWFNWRATRGTVYLMRPRSRPDLFKIGYTVRPAEQRRRELEKKSDRGLEIICSVTMPHAYALEQKLLRKMRGGWCIFRRRRNKRGTEWFHLKPGEKIEQIRDLVLWEARRTRLLAALRFSWPIFGRVKSFVPVRPPVQKDGISARQRPAASRWRRARPVAGSRSRRR